MKAEQEVMPRAPLHQRSWFMWLWLIIFPPVGVIFLWIQKKLSNVKKTILTVIAGVYFIITPIILFIILMIIWNPTIPLYYSHDEFVEAFNHEVQKQDLPYTINITEEEQNLITSELGKDIILLENIDQSGNVQELIMIGQGGGTDIVLIIGMLIGMTNTDLGEQEIGQILKELRLFDESYQFNANEVTVEQDRIRYNLKYDQSIGVILSVSRIN